MSGGGVRHAQVAVKRDMGPKSYMYLVEGTTKLRSIRIDEPD